MGYWSDEIGISSSSLRLSSGFIRNSHGAVDSEVHSRPLFHWVTGLSMFVG